MNHVVNIITWSIHPRFGHPIFQRQNDTLITRELEATSSFDTVVEFGRSTWGSAYLGCNMAAPDKNNKIISSPFTPGSELYRLWYIQINSSAFSSRAENDWGFFSREELYRRAARQFIDIRLLGELALIDYVPSPELRKLMLLHH